MKRKGCGMISQSNGGEGADSSEGLRARDGLPLS